MYYFKGILIGGGGLSVLYMFLNIIYYRYSIYGEVCHRMAALLHDPQVLNFFVELIQRVMPKSFIQARGEVLVVRKFLENFSGDQVKKFKITFLFKFLFLLKNSLDS